MTRLALFDMDQTLIAGDTQALWYRYLGERGLVDTHQAQRTGEALYADYVNGTLDIDACMRFELAPQSSEPRNIVDQWRADFFGKVILAQIKPPMQLRLENHRTRGDRLILITAANHWLAEPLFEHFGMHDLVATIAEQKGNQFTGHYTGVAAFGEGKVQRLQALSKQHGFSLDGSTFYSDSHNDLPLMRKAAVAVAVDPCPALRAEAERCGWEIIDTPSL
ncbi:HAD-IB family hydrolase [Gammaproteobacteria bacterium]|nr:HAD-IB family hydrolase [Gammaproteobacteria bacterium]